MADLEATIKQQLDQWYGAEASKVAQLKEEISKVELDAYKTKIKTISSILERRKEVIKGIKGFWAEALMQSNMNPAFIDSLDAEALKALEDVEVVFSDDPRAFAITFTFGANKNFENTVLTKIFDVKPDLGPLEKYSLDAELVSTPVPIKWKSDQVNLVRLKPRPSATEAEEYDAFESGSFFNFFTEATDPADLSAHVLDFYLTAHDIYARLTALFGDDDDASEDEEDEDDDPTAEINLSDDDRPKKRRKP